MFYISRKVGRKYGIVDTDDNVEEFYSMKDIEEFNKRGIQIKGVSYINKRFIITPVPNVKDKSKSIMLKMMSNSGSGYKGFNLDFVGDKVIALPLTREFFIEASKNAVRKGFVLEIPEIVTELADDFFSSKCESTVNFLNINCQFTVVIPKSVKVIGKNALSSYLISNVIYDGKFEEIRGGDYGWTLKVASTVDTDFKSIFSASILRTNSILATYYATNSRNNNSMLYRLYLPDIEVMNERAINKSKSKKILGLFLGNKINRLHSFVDHSYKAKDNSGFGNGKVSKVERMDTFLMRNATAVFLDDNTSVDTLSMSDTYWFSDNYYTPYIFIMSRGLWRERLKRVFDDGFVDKSIAVGVLLYDTKEECDMLSENIGRLCYKHRINFRKHLDEDSLGHVRMLELFDKLYFN